MYRFKGTDRNGTAVEPLPGLPIEASDKDFNESLREYEAQHGEGSAQAVRRSDLYEHVKDEPEPKPAAAKAEE